MQEGRAELKDIVGQAREKKTLKFSTRLRPILTEGDQVPKFLGRHSPIGRDSPQVRLRKYSVFHAGRAPP